MVSGWSCDVRCVIAYGDKHGDRVPWTDNPCPSLATGLPTAYMYAGRGGCAGLASAARLCARMAVGCLNLDPLGEGREANTENEQYQYPPAPACPRALARLLNMAVWPLDSLIHLEEEE